MTRLGLLPDQFWHLTPAEFSDLLLANRSRTNFDAVQRAFEVYMLLLPHVSGESTLTTEQIFRSFPGAFPEDVDSERGTGPAQAGPPGMTDEQRAEYERRRNLPRINRLGKNK